jgi:NAD(P)-dependent dehydrogenase (short-subunit alcohol dehydrogenase family)
MRMAMRLDGQVVVMGGGDAGLGAAVTRALLASGARVVVPVPGEQAAERFYLDADPEAVPRLRTAIGAPDEPATLARIAAVARREFGGIDHLVAAFPAPAEGGLWALDADAAHAALRGSVTSPGLFVLGLLRHLTGAAPEKRVVLLVTSPSAASGPDAAALGRMFAGGLVSLLRAGGRPGVAFHVLRAAAGAAVEPALVRLLAEGATGAEVDAAAT